MIWSLEQVDDLAKGLMKYGNRTEGYRRIRRLGPPNANSLSKPSAMAFSATGPTSARLILASLRASLLHWPGQMAAIEAQNTTKE
jgi:hypothetical protein